MATIQVTFTRTGQTIPPDESDLADTDLDAIVAAYQNDADAYVGGTASYADVLNFCVIQWYNQMTQHVQRQNTTTTVPPPIVIS